MARELLQIRQRMERRDQLQQQKSNLEREVATLEGMLPQLERSMYQEQEDVERFEEGGISSLFYEMIGRQEQKLQKERREAQQAREKYQAALVSLQERVRQLEIVSDAIVQLGDPQREYQVEYQKKRQELLQSNTSAGALLRRAEEDGRQIRALQKELAEAREVGVLVQERLDCIQRNLQDASTWGMVDTFSDGFFADVVKYSSLNSAQKEIDELNQLLRKFSGELKDVSIPADLSVELGKGLCFADIFFDNFLVDAIAMQRIEQVRQQIKRISFQVDRRMDALNQYESSLSIRLAEKAREADSLIVNF